MAKGCPRPHDMEGALTETPNAAFPSSRLIKTWWGPSGSAGRMASGNIEPRPAIAARLLAIRAVHVCLPGELSSAKAAGRTGPNHRRPRTHLKRYGRTSDRGSTRPVIVQP